MINIKDYMHISNPYLQSTIQNAFQIPVFHISEQKYGFHTAIEMSTVATAERRYALCIRGLWGILGLLVGCVGP